MNKYPEDKDAANFSQAMDEAVKLSDGVLSKYNATITTITSSIRSSFRVRSQRIATSTELIQYLRTYKTLKVAAILVAVFWGGAIKGCKGNALIALKH